MNEDIEQDDCKIDNFEHYMQMLEDLISNMENKNNITLKQFLNDFEKGAELIQKCENILNLATIKVKVINEKLSQNKIDD
jgi:exodeoxyribonuclease VII small subunit